MFFRRKSPLISLENVGYNAGFLYDDRLYLNMGASVDGPDYPVLDLSHFGTRVFPRTTLVLPVTIRITYQ